eukprot:SAG11_NODE_201_length_12551_cov_67.866126_10_plen_173_part_00
MPHVGGGLHVGPVHDVIVGHAGTTLISNPSMAGGVWQKIRRDACGEHRITHDVGEPVRGEAPKFAIVLFVRAKDEEKGVVRRGESGGEVVVLIAHGGKARRVVVVVNHVHRNPVRVTTLRGRHRAALFRGVEAEFNRSKVFRVVRCEVETDALDLGSNAAADGRQIAGSAAE